MRYALITLLAALAGCAFTPQEVLDEGIVQERKSALTPTLAALCLIRKVEADPDQPYNVHQRLLDDRGGIELVVRILTRATQMIVRYTPASTGTNIRVWMLPRTTELNRARLEALFDGC